ncbi:MAG TPA: hypothetical protein VLR94_03605 [Acidobacteriota bacterium]|nr:hypothetical protein [Acidobacteriota bacterium]
MMIHTIEEAISRLRYVQLDSEYPPSQIVHMILAGGSSQPLYNVFRGEFEPAVEFLCKRTREIASYPIPGGVVREEHGRPFFSKGFGRSFTANERPNEFLGILATSGLHLQSTGIITDRGTEGTLADMADAAMVSYALSAEEQSWSLMLFSVYPGVTSEWKNGRGELMSVERILASILPLPYGTGSCFGTHRIEGISFAVSRFCLEQDREPSQLEGIWKQAYEKVAGAIALMKRNQKDDGSIDRCWFREKSVPRTRAEWAEKIRDIAARRQNPSKAIIYPTGHCLDAISPLALFVASEQEWIASAVYIVAQTIEMQWIQIGREIKALTHAIHALKLIGE